MTALTTLVIDARHPALEGHFPGSPIVPGVVLLDAIVRSLEDEGGADGSWRIGSAKFLQPVRPGEALTLVHERLTNGSIRFSIERGGQPVAQGVLVPDGKQAR
jgi:3-hydroxyacyl-[acyl-carrier-protein] dehydratase